MSDFMDIRLFIEVYVTLFVIMDPPGTVPIFLGLTGSMTAKQRAGAARTAIFVAAGVILAFAAFGQQLLTYMHISIPALQASGGLLLLLIAMQLLTGKMEEAAESPANKNVNVALVPLGTPLLAGPGAIVASMLFVQRASDATDWLALALGFLAICITLWASMRFAGVIHKLLGESGTILVTRIAGLLLAAIAVQLIADAVIAFVRGAMAT
ncbi:MarC family protein [Jonesia quinghaiensis]|uniref:MarC family protein n=1 Tax=Jonesia quinghaiensis TaxID=262806 RepID=UPI0003FEECDD|nr:MarC family protein [Jonesia quinghaiensis]